MKDDKEHSKIEEEDEESEDQEEDGRERGAQAYLDAQPSRDRYGRFLQELVERLGGPPRREVLLRRRPA